MNILFKIEQDVHFKKIDMEYISRSWNGKVLEKIMGALLAVDLKTVPSNARYLGSLAKEKHRVLRRLQEGLVEANIYLEPAVFEAGNLSGIQIFQALQQYKPDSAEVVILHNRKLRESVSLVERVLNMIVSFNHSRVITQQLLHIEFLDEQIKYVLDEIESGIYQSERGSLPVSWQETFGLGNTLPQPMMAENLMEADFDMNHFQQKRANFSAVPAL